MENAQTMSESTGILGVIHLRDLWQRSMDKRAGKPVNENNTDLKFDRLVIDGLGISIEETVAHLFHNAPNFGEFEQWILAKNDGAIDGLEIERINCIITGRPYSENLRQRIGQTEQASPVLSPNDIRFWDEHGYVILKNAVMREAAQASEDAVWEYLGMSAEEPESWYSKAIGKGIMMNLYHHPALNENRRSPRIRKAFAQLWGSADLCVSTDRAGFNPPETSSWKFPGPRLHWDMNLAPPFHFGLQGILYLNDVAADQGAFACVPGFHKKLENWLTNLPENVNPREVNLDDEAIPIPAQAGDLIIWHQFLPHGSSANHGKYPRLVQYLTMYPFMIETDEKWI
jgi:hypothetical protein